MKTTIPTFAIVASGALCHWTLSGFKGSFNEQLSVRAENDSRYCRNFTTGLAISITLLVVVSVIVRTR
jgi:hypothetical protein